MYCAVRYYRNVDNFIDFMAASLCPKMAYAANPLAYRRSGCNNGYIILLYGHYVLIVISGMKIAYMAGV